MALSRATNVALGEACRAGVPSTIGCGRGVDSAAVYDHPCAGSYTGQRFGPLPIWTDVNSARLSPKSLSPARRGGRASHGGPVHVGHPRAELVFKLREGPGSCAKDPA
jgi:hypothetical protein